VFSGDIAGDPIHLGTYLMSSPLDSLSVLPWDPSSPNKSFTSLGWGGGGGHAVWVVVADTSRQPDCNTDEKVFNDEEWWTYTAMDPVECPTRSFA
jgi:hypothetical protein